MTTAELRRTRIAPPPIDVHVRLQPQRRRRNHRHRRRNPSRHRKRHCLRTPATRQTYVWGGSGPDVIGCSELTSARIPNYRHQPSHSSAPQASYGRAVDRRPEPIRAGDIIFYRGSSPIHDNDNGDVGIAINATRRIISPKTGDVISLAPSHSTIQTVRRLIAQAG